MKEEQNNYFSSTQIFKIIIPPPSTSLPDLERYFATLSGENLNILKMEKLRFFSPNFSNDFFWKSGANKSLLSSILKNLRYFISFISPLSNKRVLILFLLDRGDKYLKNIKKSAIYFNIQ